MNCIKLVSMRVCEIIFYCFGFLWGTILVRFGLSKYVVKEVSDEEYESLLREEIDNKIRTMNEQGPNN